MWSEIFFPSRQTENRIPSNEIPERLANGKGRTSSGASTGAISVTGWPRALASRYPSPSDPVFGCDCSPGGNDKIGNAAHAFFRCDYKPRTVFCDPGYRLPAPDLHTLFPAFLYEQPQHIGQSPGSLERPYRTLQSPSQARDP